LTLEVKTQFVLDAAIAQAVTTLKFQCEEVLLLKCYFERMMLQLKLLIVMDHEIRRLLIMKSNLISPVI